MPDIFSQEALQAAIDAELANIPGNSKRAVVGYYTLTGAWRVTAIYRFDDHWTFEGTIGKDRVEGNIQGGIKVIAVW